MNTTITIDRRLNSISRGILSTVSSMAAVALLLWLIDEFSSAEKIKLDGTQIASSIIRIVTFLAMTALSFASVLGAQPKDVTSGDPARPRYKHIKLRMLALICAAIFIGDLASSTFAEKDGGWVSILQAVLIGVLAIVSVAGVAMCRAIMHMWKEAGPEANVPTWSEPTELKINSILPSLGLHLFWIGTFLIGRLVGVSLVNPFASFIGEHQAVGFMLSLEAILAVLLTACHYAKREMISAKLIASSKHRRLDSIMALCGAILTMDILTRVILSVDNLESFQFWFGLITCVLSGVAVVVSFMGIFKTTKA